MLAQALADELGISVYKVGRILGGPAYVLLDDDTLTDSEVRAVRGYYSDDYDD